MEKWMEKCSDKIGSKRLNELILPGTHNSGTHTLERTSEYSLDAPPFLLNSTVLGSISKGIVSNLSVCQTNSVDKQLRDGIRYIDLRVSADSKNELGHISHALRGQPFLDVFKEIVSFLSENKFEIVVLDVKRILGYEDRQSWEEKLIAYIGENKIDCLCPQDEFETTISELWRQNYRLIIVLPLNTPRSPFWPHQALHRAWANSPHSNIVIDFIETHRSRKISNTLHLCEYIVTCNLYTLMLNPMESLEKLTIVVHDAFHQSIQNGIHEKSVNIICIDFYTPEFVKLCVEANS
jgi:hypothetical protein